MMPAATDTGSEVGMVLLSMKRRSILFLCGILVVAVLFAAGWFTRGLAGARVYVGSGYVGDAVATLFVGEDAYGFRSSVNWTDSRGSFHDGGWPDCLPHLQNVSGIRFAGETQWVGGIGTDEVVWVDCSTR
jgi:hypothetical protein